MQKDKRMPGPAGAQSQLAEAARPTARGGRPAVLSRERILDIARQIPARELTMPIVARRLNVSSAALYRHFESRDALLAALGAQLAATFELRDADPAHWREWLLDTCVSLYRFLVDNPVILAASDWSYVGSMSTRLLETVHGTLEGAGFDTVTAVEIWGVVSGHAYLGARLMYDVPAPDGSALADVSSEALRADADGNTPRWLAVIKARGTGNPHELLEHSLRWLVSILPEPGQSAAAVPAPARKKRTR